jgi:uncharacterized protein (TIGR00290 family)
MSCIVSWSSGKDSAWMLHVLRQQGTPVTGLLTTTNVQAARVAMHGVRLELVQAQADAAGLPLVVVPLPWPCSNEEYERIMAETVGRLVASGTTHMAFGDLFLADVRRYREERLAGTGLEPLFPLFAADTASLSREMLRGGLRARLTTVDPRALDRRFAGREYDERLLDELPPAVDPCGERGEFHTFCYAGPMFARAIDIESGVTVERDGFIFTDLIQGSRDCGLRDAPEGSAAEPRRRARQ